MRRINAFSRNLTTRTPSGALFTGVLVAGMAFVAACGSDSKKTPAQTEVKPNGETVVTVPKTDTPATTVPTPVADGNSAATPGNSNAAVNSDATGSEPTLTPKSAAVQVAPTSGSPTSMPFVQLTEASSTSVNHGTSKQFALTAYDYDPCIFGYRHGYKVFPSGQFNFVGFYLVNVNPGDALVAGTYTAGTTGMRVDTAVSGSGYTINNCKAKSYAKVASGTVVISTLGVGTSTTTGTLDLTMDDGSHFTGSFGTGACAGGPTTTMTPPVPDPYACSALN